MFYFVFLPFIFHCLSLTVFKHMFSVLIVHYWLLVVGFFFFFFFFYFMYFIFYVNHSLYHNIVVNEVISVCILIELHVCKYTCLL